MWDGFIWLMIGHRKRILYPLSPQLSAEISMGFMVVFNILSSPVLRNVLHNADT
jgi:hypothetical protein